MRIVLAIVLGGLVAGTLDILFAFAVYGPLSYGLTPLQVLQTVAAGWVGRDAARAGGMETSMLGLATHFMIATVMAAVFVLAAQRIRALTRNALLWGFLYGLVLYVAMNYVVAPLSAAGDNLTMAASVGEVMTRLQVSFTEIHPDDPSRPWLLPAVIGAHTLLVGVPIALIAKKFAPQID